MIYREAQDIYEPEIDQFRATSTDLDLGQDLGCYGFTPFNVGEEEGLIHNLADLWEHQAQPGLIFPPTGLSHTDTNVGEMYPGQFSDQHCVIGITA